MRAEHGLPLLKLAVKNRSKLQADLAADVLIPPLTQVVKANALLGASAFIVSVARKRFGLSSAVAALAIGGLGAHVGAGWRRSGVGVSVLAKLPGYLRWKSGLTFGSSGADNAWVRTRRIGEDDRAASSKESSTVVPSPSVSAGAHQTMQASGDSTRLTNEVRP
jgi:hypothetical protein